MRSYDLISNIRALGPQPTNVFLQYLADHFHEFRSRTGHRLFTVEDAKDFIQEAADHAGKVCGLMELVEVAPALALRTEARPPASQRRYDPTCPRCGHIHEGIGQCGMSMGSAGLCRCEFEVSA